MPPFVARKRSRSASPSRDAPPPKRKAVTKPKTKPPPKRTSTKKASLLEEVDNAKTGSDRSLADNKAFIANISDDDDDDEADDVDSDDFEDVELHNAAHSDKRGKAKATSKHQDTDDEEMDWEHVMSTHDSSIVSTKPPSISGDLELTLNALPAPGPERALPNGKKGPTKIERQVRLSTHCMHVQFLLFSNHVRNVWANDDKVQQNLQAVLSPAMKKEVERWKSACGDLLGEEKAAAVRVEKTKSKSKENEKPGKNKTHRNQRDWGHKADHAEQGTPNISRGDPTLRLLKTLGAFWRKRFTVISPAIRKQGYKDMKRLQEEMKLYQDTPGDEEAFGERIEGLKEFRELAKRCHGSRDVGAQLFTALLRAVGVEARLVVSLQPAGYGWSKGEDAKPKKEKGAQDEDSDMSEGEEEALEAAIHPNASTPPKQKELKKAMEPVSPKKKLAKKKSMTKGGTSTDPVKLDEDTSGLSEAPESDDDSVLDVTPGKSAKSHKRYDRDLLFPTSWTEVLSPITNTWIPVDPIVLNTVANTSDTLLAFEPRGAKADRAKQVMAYIVAYSPDLTAKDVTVRYLKRHMWPGKTKGMRMAVEKIPIYNKRGKILRHDSYDFFAHVLRPYIRHPAKHTAADRLEDTTDLVPVHPTRDTAKPANEESLQSYKSSAEFVLERHLRREEALLPRAAPVKTFTAGKGDKTKSEPVYLRADVVACKTIESWHKEGRAVTQGQQPLKHVPVRAVTLQRKREIEEVERSTGEKMKQPLYGRHQTDWIIPPPIVDGVIPKNAFGNMDVYVETMVPAGAVHLSHRGTAKVCRRLGIDFAEACTGFEFGNKRAVPVLTGVVVARENREVVMDAWRAEQKEKARKEQEKREKLALLWWRKMARGLAIVERVRSEYGEGVATDGHVEEELKKKGGRGPAKVAPSASKAGGKKGRSNTSGKANSIVDLTSEPEPEPEDDSIDPSASGSGFFPTGSHDHTSDHGMTTADADGAGGFPTHDAHSDLHSAGGFILEDETAPDADTSMGDTPEMSRNAGSRKPKSLMAMAKHTPATPDHDHDHDSSLSSLHDDDEDVESESDATPAKRTSKAKAKPAAKANPAAKVKPPPKVKAVPAVKATSAVKATAKVASEPATKRTPAAAAKTGKAATVGKVKNKTAPAGRVKSKYFALSDDDDDDDDDEEEYEDDDNGAIARRGQVDHHDDDDA